jgi:hypothetical protein
MQSLISCNLTYGCLECLKKPGNQNKNCPGLKSFEFCLKMSGMSLDFLPSLINAFGYSNANTMGEMNKE